jgi:cysteine desulfurase
MNNSTKRYYLDWAATAIPDYGAQENAPFGNPSSLHAEGRAARDALEDARARCAAVLRVPPETLCFTSGGTEANALVLFSLVRRAGKSRVLYSAVEHPSVRENCLALESLGHAVNVIAVEKNGAVSERTFERALEKYGDARFAAVMSVNNETGAVTDVAALCRLLRAHEKKTGRRAHFHSDRVQALGKIPVDLRAWDIDSAAFSAHKLGGPRGIGLLYLKDAGKNLHSLYSGGKQERGIRPGTENTQGALAFAELLERRAADEYVRRENEAARARMKRLLENLKKIPRCKTIPETRAYEPDGETFSPWILQAQFKDVPGEVMVRALDDHGVAISTGSACSATSRERTVLRAMGLDESAQLEGIRISQGWSTTHEDFDALLTGIEKTLSFLK